MLPRISARSPSMFSGYFSSTTTLGYKLIPAVCACISLRACVSAARVPPGSGDEGSGIALQGVGSSGAAIKGLWGGGHFVTGMALAVAHRAHATFARMPSDRIAVLEIARHLVGSSPTEFGLAKLGNPIRADNKAVDHMPHLKRAQKRTKGVRG